MSFKIVFYEKNDCHELVPHCLPQSLPEDMQVSIFVPEQGSHASYTFETRDYRADMLLVHRAEYGGYVSYQLTVKTQANETIAVCSRYESIDTLENVIVWTCVDRYKESLIGVKATTTEKMGVIGDGNGIAVYAIASLKNF